MCKRHASALLLVGALTVVRVASLSAHEETSGVVSQNGPAGSMFRLPNPEAWRLSTDDAGAQSTKKEKVGRKAMWITIAASVAAVSVAVAMAPREAPIPPPGRTSGGCASFVRWGTLQTVSGYTCRAR